MPENREVRLRRLPDDATANDLSATVILEPIGFLAVQVLFLSEPIKDLSVEFFQADEKGRRGAAVKDPRTGEDVPTQQTDAKGIAKVAFPVPTGLYFCRIEHQPETQITTVEAPDKPFVLVLPIGRPYFDLRPPS